ncbi:class I SAM-dependent methyltransferase [Desulfoluna spongiiphila]|uniref:Methyltransferase domain-containing protein n=1 Tax=Desulfoluna spongiiphila TaxID=419481 RepID=A0A1G5AIE1_9BACT|nr:class I SAM-dependent methyltransferase [Desulfoluna spongiiphila]SCX77655.1 Methyltransferase domain-containing protein [Desulfoluna spongiiphila]
MKKFSHVKNFTGYMAKVYNEVIKRSEKQDILDIPAGNGLLSQKLSEAGHDVTCADINSEKPDYVYADMESSLPFEDERFDTIMCLEGLEHVIEPNRLVAELCRICRPNGRVIVSLPNIHNLYSRFQFLFTGTFFQFEPYANQPVGPDEKIDRGHISSLSIVQLKYLFSCYDAKLTGINGDKFKRKILIPLLSPVLLLGYLWVQMPKFQHKWSGGKASKSPNWLFQHNLLFSRSLILVFEKKPDGSPATPHE